MTIHAAIRARIARLGITDSEVGRRCGMTRQEVWKALRAGGTGADIRASTVDKLLRGLGLRVGLAKESESISSPQV